MKHAKNSRRISKSKLAITIILLIIIILLIVSMVKKGKINIINTENKNANTEISNSTNNIADNNSSSEATSNGIIQDSSKTDGNQNDNTNSNNGSNNQNTANNVTDNSEMGKTASGKAKSSETLKNGLPVLMYHFFYDKSKSTAKDNNWLEISDFEQQVKYLAEDDFYFPTWNEVTQYVDGKITLPAKSIMITVDDGDDSFFDLAVPILQKYDVPATSFVVSSWYGYRASDKLKCVSYQSHSEDMHKAGEGGKGVMLSWSYDKMLADVKKSSEVLNNAFIFCYPFGQYNDLDKKVLKDAGYKLSFTTEGGRVYKGNDKYALPRVRVSKGLSLEAFKKMVN